jgi:hypothetical protein
MEALIHKLTQIPIAKTYVKIFTNALPDKDNTLPRIVDFSTKQFRISPITLMSLFI